MKKYLYAIFAVLSIISSAVYSLANLDTLAFSFEELAKIPVTQVIQDLKKLLNDSKDNFMIRKEPSYLHVMNGFKEDYPTWFVTTILGSDSSPSFRALYDQSIKKNFVIDNPEAFRQKISLSFGEKNNYEWRFDGNLLFWVLIARDFEAAQKIIEVSSSKDLDEYAHKLFTKILPEGEVALIIKMRPLALAIALGNTKTVELLLNKNVARENNVVEIINNASKYSLSAKDILDSMKSDIGEESYKAIENLLQKK